jgi:SAM-dependent methyltransferase
MVLRAALRSLLQRDDDASEPPPSGRRRVLNVGGNSKAIPIPAHYAGWEHLLLDIDPTGGPDIVCDARDLTGLPGGQFDAVYCSHNLEHYHRHEVPRVLRGFLHVLKPDGFVEIRVPDIDSVIAYVVRTGMDVEDTLYVSPAGPIAVSDVIYGYGKQIEQTGDDFFAHKTGFTAKSLTGALARAGFATTRVTQRPADFELHAIALGTNEPTADHRALLGL